MTDVVQIPSVNLAALGASTGNAPLWYRQNYSDEVPLSYRAGLTFQEVLENIRTWIPDTLIPYLQITNAGFMESLDEVQSVVQTALQNAVDALVNGSVALEDPVILGALQAISSQSRAWLDNRYALYDAPNPSGEDDTAALQPLLLAAQTTNGMLRLRPGTYKANLASSQSFSQPRIQGANRDRTKLKALSNTAPALRLKGGSGALAGGFLSDFEISSADAGGGIGLQLADTNGVTWSRLRFSGSLDFGVEFLNEAASGFTEYNWGDADFKSGVKTAIHYKRASGANAESFHGSGVTQGTLINQAAGASTPMVLIENGCFPYNAPMTMAVFPRNSNVPIIQNLNNGRKVTFYGNIDIEVQGNAANVDIADRNQGIVYFHGGVQCLQSGTNTKMGKLYLVDKVMYNGGNTWAQLKPLYYSQDMVPGANSLNVNNIGSGIITVELVGSNYHYSYTLMCWQSPYDPTGNVTILATNKTLNSSGWGAPTLSWSNYSLVVTNASFPATGVKAYIHYMPIQTSITSDKLGQL